MTTKTQLEQFAIANNKQVQINGRNICIEWSNGVLYHFISHPAFDDKMTFVARYSQKTKKFDKSYNVLNFALEILYKAELLNS
jgi:hypothetical protein